MNQQIWILLLSTLPALFVLVAPFWVMVYFDQRAVRHRTPPATGTRESRYPPQRILRALPDPIYQKAENA